MTAVTQPATPDLAKAAAEANAAVAAVIDPKAISAELVDKATLANAALVESELAKKRTKKEGDKVLVSGVLADQVNPLTNQRITHGTPVIAKYDRWIEIQLEAGVLAESAL